MSAVTPLPAQKQCPGRCGRKVELRVACCPSCLQRAPRDVRDHLADTIPGSGARLRAMAAVKLWLREHPAVTPDPVAEQRVTWRERKRQQLRSQALGRQL